MNAFKRVFGAVSGAHLVRSYLLGLIFLALFCWLFFKTARPMGETILTLGYFGICTLLFPFAKLVWDQLKSLVLGESIILMPVILLYPLKLIVNLILWFFAIFVAPFGLAYIWWRTKAA